MLLPLLAVPVLVGVVAYFSESAQGPWRRATLKELAILEGVMLLLLAGGWTLARWDAIRDTELWNGRITDKISGTQGCCHCEDICLVEDDEGNCTLSHEVCEHNQDYWWSLEISTGDSVSAESCSGSNIPPAAWRRARIGEPAVVRHRYNNYLLADPDSVLLEQHRAAPSAEVPAYPHAHSLYRARRALGVGPELSDAWNTALDELNADLGADKQVNVILVVTHRADPAYADAVARDWLFGKKNDAILVVGAPEGSTIAWARAVALGNPVTLDVMAQELLPGHDLADVPTTSAVIRRLVAEHFERKPMAEYAYLWASARPGPYNTVALYVFAVLGSLGGTWLMRETDWLE